MTVMESDNDDELTFEPLASANSRVIERLAATLREQRRDDDAWKRFQEMKGSNSNSAHANAAMRERRGS